MNNGANLKFSFPDISTNCLGTAILSGILQHCRTVVVKQNKPSTVDRDCTAKLQLIRLYQYSFSIMLYYKICSSQYWRSCSDYPCQQDTSMGSTAENTKDCWCADGLSEEGRNNRSDLQHQDYDGEGMWVQCPTAHGLHWLQGIWLGVVLIFVDCAEGISCQTTEESLWWTAG